jgi:cell envelope opacity-associated protein A
MALSIDRSVGVGSAVIGLIGTGMVVLWPEKRWFGWLFLAVALLIASGTIIWALARRQVIKEYERERPLAASNPAQQMTQTGIDFKPHIEVNPVFNQTHSQEQPIAEATAVQAELECNECYFVQGILSPSNLLVNDAGIHCMIAQADFYLKPIPGSDPWIELRTQLVFYDQNGNERLKRVSDGVWRETVNFIQMPLNTGDTRRLVIALDLGNVGFNGYQYAVRHPGRHRFTTEGVFTHILAPEVIPLKADELTVQVLLSGKYNDRVTLNKEVWFKLSRPNLTIEKIESPRGIETDMKTQF